MGNIFDDMNEIKSRFDKVILSLGDRSEESAGINIIIDNSDAQNPVFVEIENDKGKSIRIGEELTTSEGYRKLRINASDIISAA